MQRKLMGLLMFVAASAFAQTSAPLSEDDPAVWAARSARAAHLRKESSSMRREADAQRAQADLACRKKFLENACKDSAREEWIEQINKVRAMEIEAAGLEHNQRAHEIAMREKNRSSAPARPPLILPHTASRPSERPNPEGASVAGDPASPPKPMAKPIDPRKRAERDAQRQQNREESEKQAAARAEQARKDAARYEARAKEHARKEAERKAGKAVGAPLAAPVK